MRSANVLIKRARLNADMDLHGDPKAKASFAALTAKSTSAWKTAAGTACTLCKQIHMKVTIAVMMIIETFLMMIMMRKMMTVNLKYDDDNGAQPIRSQLTNWSHGSLSNQNAC